MPGSAKESADSPLNARYHACFLALGHEENTMIFDDFSELNFRRMGVRHAILQKMAELHTHLDISESASQITSARFLAQERAKTTLAFLTDLVNEKLDLDTTYHTRFSLAREEPNE